MTHDRIITDVGHCKPEEYKKEMRKVLLEKSAAIYWLRNIHDRTVSIEIWIRCSEDIHYNHYVL